MAIVYPVVVTALTSSCRHYLHINTSPLVSTAGPAATSPLSIAILVPYCPESTPDCTVVTHGLRIVKRLKLGYQSASGFLLQITTSFIPNFRSAFAVSPSSMYLSRLGHFITHHHHHRHHCPFLAYKFVIISLEVGLPADIQGGPKKRGHSVI